MTKGNGITAAKHSVTRYGDDDPTRWHPPQPSRALLLSTRDPTTHHALCYPTSLSYRATRPMTHATPKPTSTEYTYQTIFTWPNEVAGIPCKQSHDFDGVLLNGDGSVVLGGRCYARGQAIASSFNGITASREQGSPTITLVTPAGQTFLLNYYSRRLWGLQITGVWSRLVPCEVPVKTRSTSAAVLFSWTVRKFFESFLWLGLFLGLAHYVGLAATLTFVPDVPKNSGWTFVGLQCYGLPIVFALFFVFRVVTYSVDEHWRVLSWRGLANGTARTAIHLLVTALAFLALPGWIQAESARLFVECWRVVPSGVESATASLWNAWSGTAHTRETRGE